MFRFSIIPCLIVIILPIVLGGMIRLMVRALRAVGGDEHRGRRPIPRAGGRGRSRGRRQVRTVSYSQGQDPAGPPAVDAERICPNTLCQQVNRPEAQYCARCGTRLTQ